MGQKFDDDDDELMIWTYKNVKCRGPLDNGMYPMMPRYGRDTNFALKKSSVGYDTDTLPILKYPVIIVNVSPKHEFCFYMPKA